jgi:single-strand DNA-binding protein
MTVTIEGQIIDIFPVETYGNNFNKRVAWVQEIGVQYPNTYPLEFQQMHTALLDRHVPGDKVRCSVDLRGRQWEKNGKKGCMVTLKCWQIEMIGAAKPGPTPSTRQQTGGPRVNSNDQQQDQWQAPPVGGGADDDDLPF